MALASVHNNISKNDIVSMKNLMLLALYSFFNPAEFIVWEIAENWQEWLSIWD